MAESQKGTVKSRVKARRRAKAKAPNEHEHVVNGEYYTVATFAAKLHLHPVTVYRLIARGKVAALKIGGAVRIPANQVVDDSRTRKGKSRR